MASFQRKYKSFIFDRDGWFGIFVDVWVMLVNLFYC